MNRLVIPLSTAFNPGWIYDRTGKYTASFLAAGVPPIVGALFMFCIYRVRGNSVKLDAAVAGATADDRRANPEEDEALIGQAVGSSPAAPPPLFECIRV